VKGDAAEARTAPAPGPAVRTAGKEAVVLVAEKEAVVLVAKKEAGSGWNRGVRTARAMASRWSCGRPGRVWRLYTDGEKRS
jgi:hypothetical protein